MRDFKLHQLQELRTLHAAPSDQHEAPRTEHKAPTYSPNQIATGFKLLSGQCRATNVRGRMWILDELKTNGPKTVAELHEATGLSRTHIYRYCKALAKQNLIWLLPNRPLTAEIREDGIAVIDQIYIGYTPTEELIDFCEWITQQDHRAVKGFQTQQRLKYLLDKRKASWNLKS